MGHSSCSRYSLLESLKESCWGLLYYFLQVRFRKQIMQYTGAARGSIVRVKPKAGVQGAEPLGGGQGAKPPEANAF